MKPRSWKRRNAKRLNRAALEHPVSAILHGLHRLDDETLAQVAAKEPKMFATRASQYLTPSLMDQLCKVAPSEFLKNFSHMASAEQLKKAAEKSVFWAALKYAPSHLSVDHLTQAVEKEPEYALSFAAQYLNPAQFNRAVELAPTVAVNRCHALLSEEQLAYCARYECLQDEIERLRLMEACK